jgi:hypothetical protein
MNGNTSESALTNFSFICHHTIPFKIHTFAESLVSQFLGIFQERKQNTIVGLTFLIILKGCLVQSNS